MPKREVLYQGKFHTVELAVIANGRCPAKKFLNGLSKDDREKILRVIKRLADEGKLTNREQFKKIEGEDFFEFKNSSFAPLNWGKVVERIGDSVEISSKLGFGTSKLGQSV